MPTEEALVERIDHLLAKGDRVLATELSSPRVGAYLDSGAFVEWQAQTRSLLTSLFGDEHAYVGGFTEQARKNRPSSVRKGQGIPRVGIREVRPYGVLGSW